MPAEDIAEITLRRGNEVIPELLSVLSATGREAVGMIRSAIAAYASEDLTLAAEVIAQDDVVDNYFSEIKQKLTRYFAQEHPEIDCAIDYLMIAKYRSASATTRSTWPNGCSSARRASINTRESCKGNTLAPLCAGRTFGRRRI